MKVIISHDVDHLFRDDHYRDLIYPKLWVRSSLELIKRKYSVREWFYRMLTPFSEERHHIPDTIAFDRKNGIESTFFSAWLMDWECHILSNERKMLFIMC